jgi:hypothetical protein
VPFGNWTHLTEDILRMDVNTKYENSRSVSCPRKTVCELADSSGSPCSCKGKVTPWLMKHHNKKMCGGVKVYLPAFLALILY